MGKKESLEDRFSRENEVQYVTLEPTMDFFFENPKKQLAKKKHDFQVNFLSTNVHSVEVLKKLNQIMKFIPFLTKVTMTVRSMISLRIVE